MIKIAIIGAGTFILSCESEKPQAHYLRAEGRRLRLWRGVGKNSGVIKGIIRYNLFKTGIEEIRDDSKRDD